ncbi:unnamed protein product [Rhodiola kirilowii]
MSGGTPVAGGLMRQRHSQGYASIGDDLEDDACSRHAATFFAPMQKQRTWVDDQKVKLRLWLDKPADCGTAKGRVGSSFTRSANRALSAPYDTNFF